ncbi:heme oxygenase (biliverdin-producing) [Amycolatopsis cihanbeyliensis]|uniref:Heme oxygenase n=1 Tax=Amycolatopsis cihanbeyliensis TaxID=1128664 RepID=A0A542DIR8_AMYCI|nr:biliverdin-producing heme oxygenase [Amycolatopsis cihanbeyliensis]TQJ02884.1 heme oxygenase [Amycolatopsis cihanbeyliensis]
MAAPTAATSPDLDESTTFARTLRESTREVHDRAHHSAYMDALLEGRLSLHGYAQLAAQYYFIYQALEQASDAMADDPVGAPFVIDELRRMPALRADLEFLLGPDWEARLHPVEATKTYVRRMHAVAFDWPGGYVAHHYTRYLGDLAGGQVVRSLLRKTYGVEGAGALFYDFSTLGSPSAFRGRYRELLNTAGWDAAERERIIAETLTAFELNIDVLTELAEAVVPATSR